MRKILGILVTFVFVFALSVLPVFAVVIPLPACPAHDNVSSPARDHAAVDFDGLCIVPPGQL